jgi:nitrogen-specific signal transduction histidine kinase/ActR/RegA family two-component response regulator
VLIATVNAFLRTRKAEAEREQLLESERAARMEAERANRFKDEFLATLSHELRTPLHAIVGWAQLLKMEGIDPNEAREGLDVIERNAKAQAQMIADLLDVSRITSGKLRLDVQPVDPAAMIETSLAAIMPAAAAKGIRVHKVLDPHAGPISGDPARLQQVIWNLVNNAVKFTPKNGKVQVTLRRIDSHIEIAVADSGQGIGKELLPNIFDRFLQGDASTTRDHGGLGLGLAIAKQLVEMHGGTISAQSEGEGTGATFRVRLPISVSEQLNFSEMQGSDSSESIAVSRDDLVSLSGVRVLLVDDDADSRSMLRRILVGTGASVFDASSAALALDAIAETRPHVLLSDIGMPEQDGFDLIYEVRARGYSFQDLPAIALTAFARPEDRRRAMMAGFQVHVAKPVDPRELTATIATLLGRTGGTLK